MNRKNKIQRATERHRTRNLVSVHSLATGEKVISNLLNISKQGASFISKWFLGIGDELELHLKIPVAGNELKNIEIRARVVWIEPIEESHNYLTGVQFLNLSEEAYQVILAWIGAS